MCTDVTCLLLAVCVCVCSLDRLSQMFELPVKEVHSIVSRMIIKEELLVRVAQIICIECCVLVVYILCVGFTG